MNAAEKRLAAAQASVDDAEARLRGAEVERNTVHAEAQTLDGQIRSAIYTATTAGTSIEVTADRERLGRLREQLDLLEPVTDALTDGVRRGRAGPRPHHQRPVSRTRRGRRT